MDNNNILKQEKNKQDQINNLNNKKKEELDYITTMINAGIKPGTNEYKQTLEVYRNLQDD
tara:strand:- start:36793 stop:36972 length:180 start_codon:yes stop_codon:yes gene_type:complete